MQRTVRLHSKGVSMMWPLTHISAGLDPERGRKTANGVWLSINPWTAILLGCWGRLCNAIIPSIWIQVAQYKLPTYATLQTIMIHSSTMTNTRAKISLDSFLMCGFLFPSPTNPYESLKTREALPSHDAALYFSTQLGASKKMGGDDVCLYHSGKTQPCMHC